MRQRQVHTLLAALFSVLFTACVTPSGIEDSTTGDRTPEQSPANSDAQTLDQGDQGSQKQASEEASEAACQLADTSLQPLTTPANGLLFEQFNFQPQDIAVSRGSVLIQTPYYSFSKCGGKDWAIASNAEPSEEPMSYAQYLNLWANPEYSTIEFEGKTYEYRIRLQANWLNEQVQQEAKAAKLDAAIENTLENSPENTEALRTAEWEQDQAQAEEAIYFDLKTPEGEVTSHQLYTMTEVQEAGIGASLGVPRIADTVVTANAIWFAATSSQGEGENGFASLLRYNPSTDELAIQRPSEIQGDQITSMVATNSTAKAASDEAETGTRPDSDEGLTLWLGTMRSGEGNPTAPASGLVAYQPASQQSNAYGLSNSPIVGAIPHQLAVIEDSLWVATGNGICEANWQSIDQAKSWKCWEFTAVAALPAEGIDLYDSFLAKDAATTLKDTEVEVLWASSEDSDQLNTVTPGTFRYEVVYQPGFEATLAQGGYRLNNEVARKMSGGEPIFWPGRQWHWGGDRFKRTLDEVSLNLVGGGPQGLIGSSISTGFSFDHYAIRGDFDLISLELDGTEIRYYSGWVDGTELAVYPKMVAVKPAKNARPNPLGAIAQNLPNVGP